jgi:hypothetical protein
VNGATGRPQQPALPPTCAAEPSAPQPHGAQYEQSSIAAGNRRPANVIKLNYDATVNEMGSPTFGRCLAQIQCKQANRDAVVGRGHHVGRRLSRGGTGSKHHDLQLVVGVDGESGAGRCVRARKGTAEPPSIRVEPCLAPTKESPTPCYRCGLPMLRGQELHLDHDDHDRSIIRGFSHKHCNLRAAARKARAIQIEPRWRRQQPADQYTAGKAAFEIPQLDHLDCATVSELDGDLP